MFSDSQCIAPAYQYTSYVHMQVKKRQVDQFEPGKLLPGCQLLLHKVEEQATILFYQVNIKGAKEPLNYLAIESEIDTPPSPPPPSPHTTSGTQIFDEGIHTTCI